ncbi:MAG: hypothetical protein AAB295_06250 [Chloroflexota bacterium]
MTTGLRSLQGIVFAALLALSLIATAADALASTSAALGGDGILMERGSSGRGPVFPQPRGWGRFGVTWE